MKYSVFIQCCLSIGLSYTEKVTILENSAFILLGTFIILNQTDRSPNIYSSLPFHTLVLLFPKSFSPYPVLRATSAETSSPILSTAWVASCPLFCPRVPSCTYRIVSIVDVHTFVFPARPRAPGGVGSALLCLFPALTRGAAMAAAQEGCWMTIRRDNTSPLSALLSSPWSILFWEGIH